MSQLTFSALKHMHKKRRTRKSLSWAYGTAHLLAGAGSKDTVLAFETDGAADTLEITPPKPTSPNEIDPNNGDRRKLGIGFVALKIKECH